MLYALVLFYSVAEVGLTEAENGGKPYVRRVRKYATNADALYAFSETPCSWSEIVTGETDEELLQKSEALEMRLLAGEYRDYM